jgi:hypothetical protein
MRRWLLVLPLLLGACATEPPLEARLQPLVGRSEAELVTAFGVPAQTYEAGGERFLQYEERTSTVYPGDAYFGGPYRRFGPAFYSPPLVVNRVCAITFVLRGGTVQSFSFRGNGCR